MSLVPQNSSFMGGRERRQQLRHLVRWAVEVRRKQTHGLASYHGHTADISVGGVRVYVDGNIPTGETIYIRLTVQPHGGNIRIFDLEVIVQVMHVSYSSKAQNFELGLRFVEFKKDGKAQLADVIAHFDQQLSALDVAVLHEHR